MYVIDFGFSKIYCRGYLLLRIVYILIPMYLDNKLSYKRLFVCYLHDKRVHHEQGWDWYTSLI